MATYTIVTSRKQQIGLQYSYDTYADKTIYTTIDAWLQFKVSSQVTNPMYDDQQQAQSVSFDQSFKTVPDASQPKAKADVEAAIIANGGTIVPAGPIGLPPPVQPQRALIAGDKELKDAATDTAED
jgi:hypothetical protein